MKNQTDCPTFKELTTVQQNQAVIHNGNLAFLDFLGAARRRLLFACLEGSIVFGSLLMFESAQMILINLED